MNTFTAITTLSDAQIDSMCAFYSYQETVKEERTETIDRVELQDGVEVTVSSEVTTMVDVPNPVSKVEFVRIFIDTQLKNLMASIFFEINKSIVDQARNQLNEQARQVAEESISVEVA